MLILEGDEKEVKFSRPNYREGNYIHIRCCRSPLGNGSIDGKDLLKYRINIACFFVGANVALPSANP